MTVDADLIPYKNTNKKELLRVLLYLGTIMCIMPIIYYLISTVDGCILQKGEVWIRTLFTMYNGRHIVYIT
jgi:hypothetical protein